MSNDNCDMYEVGFKKATRLVCVAYKMMYWNVGYCTLEHVATCFLVLSISLKRLTKLTIGSYLWNY